MSKLTLIILSWIAASVCLAGQAAHKHHGQPGPDEADMATARSLISSRKEKEAVPYITKAANAGNPEAMGRLGTMLFGGRGGLGKNDAAALTWFRKAAQAGDGSAMTSLGGLYMSGSAGLPMDQVTALKWYHKASEAGDSFGTNSIGVMYLNGFGGL